MPWPPTLKRAYQGCIYLGIYKNIYAHINFICIKIKELTVEEPGPEEVSARHDQVDQVPVPRFAGACCLHRYVLDK